MKKYLVPLGGVVAVAAIVLIVLGGGGDGDDGVGGSAGTFEVPRDPMTGKTEFDIPVQDPQLVAEGEVLYRSTCAACHGSDLLGTAVGPPHLSVIYNPEHHGDGAFTMAVVNGVQAHHFDFGDMPALPGVTREDFTRILSYIRDMQRTEGFVAYP